MYCQHCGAALVPEGRFCPHCGQSTSGDATASQPPASQPKSGWRAPLWFKTLLAVIILVLGVFILTALLSEDLIDSVEDQLEAIRKGQITEAYYDFTSKQFQEATSLEQFHDFVKTYPAFYDNKTIHFNERNVHEDIGTLDAVMTAAGGQKFLVEYKLVKQSDKWKILSIKIQDNGNL